MKRKELTKFLAMMMCVAMVTGSGVPVAAADFDAEEIAVETQVEDEDYAEGDTEEVVADEEVDADTDTDAAGDAEDAADLFSDEETEVESAGDENATGLSLTASLNGGTAVNAEVTDTLEGNLFKVVNVTFSGSDLKETGNTIALTPTVDAGDTVAVGLFVQGMVRPTYTESNGVFTNNSIKTVDGAYCDCIVTHSDKTSDYYRIRYSVSAKEEIKLSGQIANGDYVSESKDATVEEKTGTYNKFAWTKEVNLTFESKDAKAEGTNTLKFKPVIGDGESLAIGISVSSGAISNPLTADSDGYYSVSLGSGNGPAKVTKTCYCTRTYADGTTENYKFNIVRKGYAGIKGSYGMSESSPANGIWITDTTTGKFKMWMPLATYPQGAMGATIYDDEGNTIQTSEYTFEMSPDYKGDNFYIEGGYLWANGAGASGDCMVVKCRDKSYRFYIKAAYGYNGKTILNARATDGITSLNTENFVDADAFATLFPEAYKENARTFYTLVTECQEAVKNNKWDSAISGKFWDDNCESAKLNKIIAMSSDIWSNIYGLKDAKDALTAAAGLDNITDETKKEELTEALNNAIAKLDEAYKAGKITSIADVNELVEAGKKDIYTINPISIADFDFTLSEKVFTYDGKAKTPEVTVKNGETVLKAGEDYDVEYKNNTKGGMATVTVTGKGIYTGVKELTFSIESPEQKPATPGTTVKDPNKTNTTISTNTAKTEYKVLNIAKTAFTKTEGNKAFKLGVKTKVKGTVAYKSNNKKVATVDKKGKVKVKGPGRAVITVTGKAKGLKTETAKITITVKPSAKLSAKAAAQSGKKLKVTWKRNKKASGYQIVVATDKSFKNVVKTVNVKKNKTVKATVKGLKSGRKYYVRVRSMKKASGGNVYGNWSKAKPVKAKK